MSMGRYADSTMYGFEPPQEDPRYMPQPPAPEVQPDLRQFAMGALAANNAYQPFVGNRATGTTPWKQAEIAAAREAEPRDPTMLDPATNKFIAEQAQDFLVPTEPWEYGAMAMGPAGRIAGKLGKMGALAAGVYGSGVDEAEAAKWKLYPFNRIGVGDTIENLARLNRHIPTKEILEKPIQPHDIPVGSWLTPLVGDRSRSGELLTHVGEKELYSPVWMQGGYQFMPEWAEQGVAWGSDKSPTTAIGNRVKRLQERGTGDVYGVYTPMTPFSVDASHHMSDTISQMMRDEKGRIIKDVSNTAAEKFDDKIKALDPEFPGVKSKILQPYLREKSMAFRDKFVKTMNSREAREAGFPDVEQARIAVTHPSLRDVPSYSGGQSIGKMTGEVEHGSQGFGLAPHYTYRSKLRGQYEGGTPALPKEILWRDFMTHLNQRDPSAAGKIWLTGLKDEVGAPLMQQYVDRQWQDTAAEYQRRNPMGSVLAP